jgi:hypothetical protein
MAEAVFFTKNNLKNLPKPPTRMFTFFYRRLLAMRRFETAIKVRRYGNQQGLFAKEI